MTFQSRDALDPGDEIARRYRILEFLGRGGVGDVYRVEDLELGIDVALKRLRPEVARHKETLKRFRHEVVLARRLQGRSVARIFDLGLDGDTLFITMEYLPGPSLAVLMADQAPFSVSEALAMGLQICEAVGEAHAIGIVHRDIKPQNILFDSSGRMKVTDFGMAYAPDVSGDTTSGSLLGTPQYMSPEQAEGLPVDPRSDVYAIGLILYELLTGVFPFSSHSPITSLVQRLRKRPVSLRTYTMEIPPKVDALVEKCLERDVRKRPRDARELGQLLRMCVTKGTTDIERSESRKRSVSAVFILLIGLISAFFVIVFGLPGGGERLEDRPIVVTASLSSADLGFARFLGTILSTCVNVPVTVREEGDVLRISDAVELHVKVVKGNNMLQLETAVISADTLDTYIIRSTGEQGIDPGDLIRKCCDLLNPEGISEIENVPWRTTISVFETFLEGLAKNDISRIRTAIAGDESWPWGHFFMAMSVLHESPDSARIALKQAMHHTIHPSAAKAVEYQIRTREGSADKVLMDILTENLPSEVSFAVMKSSMEAAVRSGQSAASAIIMSHALRAQPQRSTGQIFAMRDLLRGNASGALNWCSVMHRYNGSVSDCMMIEALARMYLGEPERAAGISRELLRIHQSEEAYILLAEASIRQRELLHAFEITAEGITRYHGSVLLAHLRNLVIQALHYDDMAMPYDSSLVPKTETILDKLIWIMYSAPSRPVQCEKLWWEIVPRHAKRAEVWLAGAWIAKYLHDPTVAVSRLKRAVRLGISENAVLQDIRFAELYIHQ